MKLSERMKTKEPIRTETAGDCYFDTQVEEWADEVILLEQVVEAAKRAIEQIYDVGYAAIPTAIDLEEAVDRILDD
jgi:hypothetical protein